MATSCTLREAKLADIPALVHIILTSFRQIPIFDRLYSPLKEDINNARDTVFFWTRRLKKEILDENSKLIIAEIPVKEMQERLKRPAERKEGKSAVMDEVELQSWEMLEWVERYGLRTVTPSTGMRVVGFALWKVRKPERLGGYVPNYRGFDKIKVWWMDKEMSIYRTLFKRKDQDGAAYVAYIKAEEDLEKEYYDSDTHYYLDNLCTDFRFHRRGLGEALVRQGMNAAKKLNLTVSTEASPKSHGLYLKLGFQEVGIWTIEVAKGETIDEPVLKLFV